MDENKNSNYENLTFETSALIPSVQVVSYNNNKEIPDVGIFAALNQENKPYNQRSFGYRSLFIPNNKNGTYDITVSQSFNSEDKQTLEVVITLDSTEFKQRAVEAIKAIKKKRHCAWHRPT